MNPLTVSAQFAAYVWYGEHKDNAGKSYAEAMRFARENWQVFLPLARAGIGTLLLKIAKVSQSASKTAFQQNSAAGVRSLARTRFSRN